MDVFFYVVPSLMITVVLLGAARVIRRSLDLRRAWSSGLTAEARCLRTYTTTSGGSGDSSVRTTLHHVYEFTTREGRVVRFEEEDGPGTVLEGDIVTVHYAASYPDKATAQPPRPGKATMGLVGVLVFFGVIIAFCVGFMVTYHQMTTAEDMPFTGMP